MKLIILSCCIIGSLNLFAQVGSDSAKVNPNIRKVQKITYHQPQYSYTPKKTNYVTQFALGIDYTDESYLVKPTWDSLGQLQNSSGFNIYWIGSPIQKNIWNQNDLNTGILNWGGGFNFNHYKSGEKFNVEFNTANLDSGFTKLETSAVQFFLFSKYEYQFGRIYPFLAINTGFNVHTVKQYSETYLLLTEYESTNQVNLNNSVNVYVAPEVGLRIRVYQNLSIVASYQQRFGSDIEIVDLHNTKFNGLRAQYTPNLNKVKFETGMFKMGLLFDFSEKKEKRIVKDGFYDTTMVEEVICPPCILKHCFHDHEPEEPKNSNFNDSPFSPVENNNSSNNDNQNSENSNNVTNDSSSSSNSNTTTSKPKKKLPAITKPKVVPKPKAKA